MVRDQADNRKDRGAKESHGGNLCIGLSAGAPQPPPKDPSSGLAERKDLVRKAQFEQVCRGSPA